MVAHSLPQTESIVLNLKKETSLPMYVSVLWKKKMGGVPLVLSLCGEFSFKNKLPSDCLKQY